MIDSALRITALGHTVSVQALTANGAALLPLLDEALPPEVRNQARPNGRELTFPAIDAVQDEDARLRSLSVFDALRTLLTLVDSPADEREAVMLGGLFAYDLVAGFEDLPALRQDQRCPDFCFYLAETLLVLDHQRGTARLQASVFSEQASEAQRLQQRLEQLQAELQQTPQPIPHQTLENMQLSCNQSDEEYGAVVSGLQEAIRQGEIFQVVPSRRFSLPCPAPLAAYQTLKDNNPSPYMFFMQDDDFTLFGASPESALKYDAGNRQIEIYPIAGTRPRGRRADGSLDLDLDSRIELEMRTDHKELAEHLMLVDLARNDLARICQAGSRYCGRPDQGGPLFVRHAPGFPGGGHPARRSRRAARLSGLHEHGHPERRAESARDAADRRLRRHTPRQLRRRGRLLHRHRRSGYLHRHPFRLR